MTIETMVLNQLILEAYTGRITWYEAAGRYPLDELIDAFYHARAAMQKTLDSLSNAQAAYVAQGNPTWSISETVTHLVYSQNFYYNQLLDITTTDMPHILEAAKGFGEGARQHVPTAELVRLLEQATAQIKEALVKTAINNDPTRVTAFLPFGKVNYQTWILLLLAHEVDHVRQALLMRRLARAGLGAWF